MKFHNIEFTEITNDSRKVKPGVLFVAIEGKANDGHLFVESALKKGAAGAVIRNKHPLASTLTKSQKCIPVENTNATLAELACELNQNPSHELKVFGVTGTNGKTTSTYLLESILKNCGLKPAVIGTVENRFETNVISTEHTTPDAIALQKLFKEFLNLGARSTAIEISSHALDQYRAWGTKLESAIFTNLTQDHLDYHITMENYFQSKAKLFIDYQIKCRAIHTASEYGKRLKELCEKQNLKVITFDKSNADIQYNQFKCTQSGTNCDFTIFGKKISFHTKLIGSFNVENIAGAIAATVGAGLPIEQVIQGIENANPAPGRLELVECNRNITVLVDYAHSPDALEKVLKTLRPLTKGRVICVFGCGGDRDKTKRPLMAKISNIYSDFSVVTSDNPRTEDPNTIIENILSGMIDSKNVHTEIDRKKAIEWAITYARPNDVVLIAGKGHENYQIIGTKKFDFDDRQIVKNFLG